MAPKFSVQVDGLMVLTALGAIAVGVVLWKRKEIVSAVNPNDPNNLINRGVNATFGEENVSGAFDYIFGAADLVQYVVTGDKNGLEYAKQVYGVNEGFGR